MGMETEGILPPSVVGFVSVQAGPARCGEGVGLES